MKPRTLTLGAFTLLTLLFCICFGLQSAHAAGGVLLFTAGGSPYVNAVQYETYTSPSAHLSYVTVKGGKKMQIQSSGIIAQIPFPSPASSSSTEDSEEMISQTEMLASKYPQYAKLLHSVCELWKRKLEADKLTQAQPKAVVATPQASDPSKIISEGAASTIPSVVTKSGQTLNNVQITRFEDDKAVISHDGGIGRLLISDIADMSAFPAEAKAAIEKAKAGVDAKRKAEADRIAAENAEKERIAKEEEDKRLAQIEEERKAKEAEEQKIAKAETEKMAREDEERRLAQVAMEEKAKEVSAEMKRLHDAALGGDRECQFQLGNLYFKGDGVEQSYDQALMWYRKAAEQGQADAQYSLGRIYAKAEGVSRDHAQAFKWLQKAADQENHQAQDLLGSLYFHGAGVEIDYIKAEQWYLKAAERGMPEAQAHLGLLYGEVKMKDKALPWVKKAAEQGLAEGQFMYAGFLVENNKPEAIKWLRRAAAQGYEGAIEFLKQMVPEETDVDSKLRSLARANGMSDAELEEYIRKIDAINQEMGGEVDTKSFVHKCLGKGLTIEQVYQVMPQIKSDVEAGSNTISSSRVTTSEEIPKRDYDADLRALARANGMSDAELEAYIRKIDVINQESGGILDTKALAYHSLVSGIAQEKIGKERAAKGKYR